VTITRVPFTLALRQFVGRNTLARDCAALGLLGGDHSRPARFHYALFLAGPARLWQSRLP